MHQATGFAFLPFLWCVNAVWFFKDAFIKQPYEEQKNVILSAIGALIWVAGLTTWIVTFQTQRAQWGETADYMSFIIPTGIA
ncbi:unnamed protein product [Timema podura]|uniref:Gamma-secretase subunit PEN-2 n=1 Tax=Timema podura TaxID=61482 RepID=A0ABN7NMI8_TIMPD|nr:unnamed protein product [Timema podura]